MEVIEEQFGPIIRGIVEDRLLLERLPEPTSSESYVAIQQVNVLREEWGQGCAAIGIDLHERTSPLRLNGNGALRAL